MFLSDKELGRSSGNKGRKQVLERASKERKARAVQKHKVECAIKLQSSVRAWIAGTRSRRTVQADLDQKLSDIANLKILLQQPNMLLPFDAIYDVLKKLLFVFAGTKEDRRRLEQIAKLVTDAAKAKGADWNATMDESTKKWQIYRLVDLCLHSITGVESGDCSSLFDCVVTLKEVNPDVMSYLRSATLRSLPTRWTRLSQLSILPQTSFACLTRRKLTEYSHLDKNHHPRDNSERNELMRLLLHFAEGSSELHEDIAAQILSVPLCHTCVDVSLWLQLIEAKDRWNHLMMITERLSNDDLPPTPVKGIPSVVWLLGNVLWLMDREQAQSPEIARLEAKALTHLLQIVPQETYVAEGVSAVWLQISDSYSVPVVYPEALNDQLSILLRREFLAGFCDQLLRFAPSGMKKPLDIERPQPMEPSAPTVAEQFGFGDIASKGPSGGNAISDAWKKVTTTFGDQGWARQLLERTGLRKKKYSVDKKEGEDVLMDRSQRSKELALHGTSSTLEPFMQEEASAFVVLCASFLARWGQQGGKNSLHVVRMLNTLAFYRLPVEGGEEKVPFVFFLWCLLQETRDFESFCSSVNLMQVPMSDSYVCALALFCATYEHLLMVVDEEEMYEMESPLPLRQVERVVVGLKRCLHSAIWLYGDLPPSKGNAEFGKYVVDTGTQLLRTLYGRCSRRPFCNVTSWVLHDLDSNQLIEEVVRGTPRANKLIYSMPYVLSFVERVKLFQRLVKQDKAQHQSEEGVGYRIHIRREAVFEDGLRKLNQLGAGLKKRINVVFLSAAGREEMGIDGGGLFKEFWLDLSAIAFDLQYGLFLSTSDHLLYPNPSSSSAHYSRHSDHLTLFQFVGRILGKALYEGIVVQPKFAHFFLSKLLHAFNNLNDLPSLDPEIYKNLMFLKSYDGDVQDLGLTFAINKDEFGEQKEVELIPGGSDKAVTNENKIRYIHLVANFYLNSQIREQSAAFRRGLTEIVDLNWLQLFNEPELQVLISGKSGALDVEDLKAHTNYTRGYYALDKRIKWLWQAVESFTPSEQAAFLRFTTSCQRAPSLGFETLNPPFCVQRVAIERDEDMLPSSSTCFNILKLPTYTSYNVLREKLLMSISAGAGFEMS